MPIDTMHSPATIKHEKKEMINLTSKILSVTSELCVGRVDYKKYKFFFLKKLDIFKFSFVKERTFNDKKPKFE